MGYVYDCLSAHETLVSDETIDWMIRTLSPVGFWSEIGGNVVVAPRQTGKTTDLIAYSNERLVPTGMVLVAVPYQVIKSTFRNAGYGNLVASLDELNDFLRGRPVNTTHLIVDEFMYVPYLSQLLSHRWKSVTMVGSLAI